MAEPVDVLEWLREFQRFYDSQKDQTAPEIVKKADAAIGSHFRQAADELEATGDDLPICEHPDDCDCERCDERNHPEEV